MSTLDRLRELVRGTGRPKGPSPSSGPASAFSRPPGQGLSGQGQSGQLGPDGLPEIALDHTPIWHKPSAPAAPVSLASASVNDGDAQDVRELVYEAVDAAGLPMPARYEVPELSGASVVETPLGRCVLVEHRFDADQLHGRLRVHEGHVSTRDVLGFCDAQALVRERPFMLTGSGSGSGSGAGDARVGGNAGSGGTGRGSRRGHQHPVDDPAARAALTGLEGAGADDLAALDIHGNRPVMFLDLETTGLSGGAGTVAFLVGLGFFEQGSFRTQQFLLPGFASERALMHAVTACLQGAGCIVTYNGSTFDLPVMETRWMFHRQPLAWSEMTHLDMVHVSRRLWRARGGEPEASCRLVYLEHDLFGVERIGDVSGFEIPGLYFEYIRHGDARHLEPVLHHNRLDLLSLAMVTARAIRLIREGVQREGIEQGDRGLHGDRGPHGDHGTHSGERGSTHGGGAPLDVEPQEWLAVGRELLRLNQPRRAEACFRDVAEMPYASAAVQAEALYARARLLRRTRRHKEAAEVWRRIVGCGSARSVLRTEAQEALAVHYEHRARDLDAAHEWAREAYAGGDSTRQREAVAHRLARLKRKIAVQTKGGPKTAYLPLSACD